MLLDSGVVRGEDIVEVRAADQHVLRRVHNESYLEKIYLGRLDRKEQLKIGLPMSGQLF